ncbi:hypothetical protein GCM10009682_45630 [Luedemannella flava]|uniref:Uncharacterized protein n=1 Tax=Luedemannella flava TaxID=349316 RepID=A0ABN2MF73_9ACTN
MRVDPLHRVSMAVVSSTTAWHQSSRVAATVRSPFIRSERLDAAAPLDDTVARLNLLRPDVLIAYASMIRMLAEEQLAGRLRIRPRAVNSSSEVLTDEGRAMATRAFGVAPFNVYAATETGGIAAECDRHHGMHLFEDLVIPEWSRLPARPARTARRPSAGHGAVQSHTATHPVRDDRPGVPRHRVTGLRAAVPPARLDRRPDRRRPRPSRCHGRHYPRTPDRVPPGPGSPRCRGMAGPSRGVHGPPGGVAKDGSVIAASIVSAAGYMSGMSWSCMSPVA